ncbi:TPA: hypothetical protein ENS27_17120 [bacterium]|nr:hypothetical protein [bacterium]
MLKTDRFTKIVLVIIAIGLCGILLKPLFKTPSAIAQSSKQYVLIGYKVSGYDNDGYQKFEVSISNPTHPGELAPLLETVNRKGYKLHSVINNNFGFQVIVEK